MVKYRSGNWQLWTNTVWWQLILPPRGCVRSWKRVIKEIQFTPILELIPFCEIQSCLKLYFQWVQSVKYVFFRVRHYKTKRMILLSVKILTIHTFQAQIPCLLLTIVCMYCMFVAVGVAWCKLSSWKKMKTWYKMRQKSSKYGWASFHFSNWTAFISSSSLMLPMPQLQLEAGRFFTTAHRDGWVAGAGMGVWSSD